MCEGHDTNRKDELDGVESGQRRRCSERQSGCRPAVTLAASIGQNCALASSNDRCTRPPASKSPPWMDNNAHAAPSGGQSSPWSPSESRAATAADLATGQTRR